MIYSKWQLMKFYWYLKYILQQMYYCSYVTCYSFIPFSEYFRLGSDSSYRTYWTSLPLSISSSSHESINLNQSKYWIQAYIRNIQCSEFVLYFSFFVFSLHCELTKNSRNISMLRIKIFPTALNTLIVWLTNGQLSILY